MVLVFILMYIVYLQGAEQVTHFCRLLHQRAPMDNMNGEDQPQMKVLSDSQKLRKVIMELIETERHYVKVRTSFVRYKIKIHVKLECMIFSAIICVGHYYFVVY